MKFFYCFFTTTTKLDIYLAFHFKYFDTVLYCDIFGSNTQYYYLVVLHIPSIVFNEDYDTLKYTEIYFPRISKMKRLVSM